MTNRKNTKRALFTSVLSMLLCVSMLLGSTFAWFTDTASTNVSTITAGNLDIQLLDADGNTLEGQTLELAGDNVSKYIEPNGTYEFETITIKNGGNVNLKYKVVITGISGDAELLKVLTWEIIVNGQAGTSASLDNYEGTLTAGESHTLKIRFTMDKDAGNEYMNKTLSGVAINVTATQATGDNDSFQDDYDKLAEYPTVADDSTETPDPDAPVVENVGTMAELQEAIAEASAQATGDIVVNLTKDFDVAGAWTAVTPSGYGTNNIVINGNGYTIYNLNDTLFVGSFGGSGSITINDLTIENANISRTKGDNGLGAGAFINYCDATGSVTLNNCHLVNSSVTCTDGYAGGLIGYTSNAMTITNCSVTGCTINGQKSAGAIVGHIGGGATVVNGCTVTGCTISETLEGRTAPGAAAIAGRLSGETLTLKGTITVKDNIINQGTGCTTAATSIYCANATADTTGATLITD